MFGFCFLCLSASVFPLFRSSTSLLSSTIFSSKCVIFLDSVGCQAQSGHRRVERDFDPWTVKLSQVIDAWN